MTDKVIPLAATGAAASGKQDAHDIDWLSQLQSVVLEPHAGVKPSAAPPVRIFLGTESAQFRPERIFVWSIEQVRDPARRYEIYLMRSLAGFQTGVWTTGFTNYRFAIPSFCNAQGRAIYNDVDQIYLTDPAELFDLELGEHGFCAISLRDSSVMVMDCACMAAHWNLDTATRVRKRTLLARVKHLYGDLDPHWNARDEEFVPGRSMVLHYTTLHTQPWRPLPDRFVYQDHPFGDLWFELERGADRAGFLLFTRDRPSRRYDPQYLHDAFARRAQTSTLQLQTLTELVRRTQARTLLDYTNSLADHKAAADGDGDSGAWFALAQCDEGVQARTYDPLSHPRSGASDEVYDGVVCDGGLALLAEEDVPWVLDQLFSLATRFVYAAVPLAESGTGPGARAWWYAQFAAAAHRHPDVYWLLNTAAQSEHENNSVSMYRAGGRLAGPQPPSVWVLLDEEAGNAQQALVLANELGWSFERKQLRFTIAAQLHNRILGASLRGIERAQSDPLQAPWPDLVIAAGRRTAPVAQWIRNESRGLTRLVQIGRKGADYARHFDVAITPDYTGLFPHPNRLQVPAPLYGISEQDLQAAVERWRSKLVLNERPVIVLLAGGGSEQFRFDAGVAQQLAAEVSAFADNKAGNLWVASSRDAGTKQVDALRAGMTTAQHFHICSAEQQDDLYAAFLALADIIVVTGDDEQMLTEACATGKPVFIYPLPQRTGPRVSTALRDLVSRRAEARPANDRGTVRPQLGPERWCARLIETGWVRPTRDLTQLHRSMIARGHAQWFAHDEAPDPKTPLREHIDRPVERIKQLFAGPDDRVVDPQPYDAPHRRSA